MIKERIKSCLLVFLIVSSIVLTFNMWINEKLWPDGYNFFSNITNYIQIEKKSKSYYLSKENISYPEKLIINNDELRNLYTHTSSKYNEIIPTILNIFKKSIENASFEPVDQTEWNNALKYKSAYASYPVAYDTELLCGILDIKPFSVEAESIKDFIIATADSSKTLSVYIKDYNSPSVYRANIDISYEKFSEIIEKYASDSINLIPYSFELNFDKSDDESVQQKIVLEPTVTLQLERERLPLLKSINAVENVYSDRTLSSNILKSFGYNTTNMQKYLDNNNTAVFVENYSSIKIYDNGLLEYKALDNSKGISLTSDSSASLYDTFAACVEFVNNLWDNTFPGEPFNVNLTSDILLESRGKSFTLTMDYYVDGYRAISHIDEDSRYRELSHGIEITVTDGRIVEYRQLFNKFKITDEFFENGSAIDAIDRMFSDNIIDSGTISDLGIAYTKNEDKWYPTWSAKTTDGKILIIRR